MHAANVIAAKFHAHHPCWPGNNLICLPFINDYTVSNSRSLACVCACVREGSQKTLRWHPWMLLKLGYGIWRNSCVKETDLNASSAWWVYVFILRSVYEYAVNCKDIFFRFCRIGFVAAQWNVSDFFDVIYTPNSKT